MFLQIHVRNVTRSLELIRRYKIEMIFLGVFFTIFYFNCRICLTRKSIGMKPVFCAISVVCLLLTNSLDLRQIRFIAAIAMTRNLLPDATDVQKSSVLVSLVHFFLFRGIKEMLKMGKKIGTLHKKGRKYHHENVRKFIWLMLTHPH